MSQKPKGTEASRTFSMNGTPLTDLRFGEDGGLNVSIATHDVDYVAIHNHSSGKTFSATDITYFAKTPHMRVLTAVGNDGHVYAVEKTSNADIDGFHLALDEAKKELSGITSVQKEHAIMDEFLKGASAYGIIYHS